MGEERLEGTKIRPSETLAKIDRALRVPRTVFVESHASDGDEKLLAGCFIE